MSKLRSLPYLTPSPERIVVGAWHTTHQNGDYGVLPKVLPEWDPAVSIQAETVVKVDTPSIFDECQLNLDAVLRLAVIWSSKGSGLSGHNTYQDIHFSNHQREIALSIDVQGINLAKQVDLVVVLVLADPGKSPLRFSPKLKGSTLFREAYSLQLEGEGSRFPTEVIDFSETQFADEAGWVLEWNPAELEQSILGDVRLYINSQHGRVKDAVSTTGDIGFDIRETIRFDVARTLIYGALENQHFVDNPEHYEDGSVGAAVFSMLRLYFPQDTLSDLRTRIQQPQAFEPQLQAKLRIFRNS